MKASVKPIIQLSIVDNEAIQLKCNYDVKMLHNRKKTLMEFITNSISTEENEIFARSYDAVLETLLWHEGTKEQGH